MLQSLQAWNKWYLLPPQQENWKCVPMKMVVFTFHFYAHTFSKSTNRMCFESFLPYLTLKRHLSTLLLFMVTTHIFLLLGPSFLKGNQIAKGCSYMHWIHHHQNKHKSCHPPGDPLGCPMKEVSEFVEKINGLGSRNKRPNDHPIGIKIQRFRPAYL